MVKMMVMIRVVSIVLMIVVSGEFVGGLIGGEVFIGSGEVVFFCGFWMGLFSGYVLN